MVATQKKRKALSGISTLIIFIALILVAAVAALVLLQTVGSLQSQALATGKESKQQVSTALQINNVIGWIDTNRSKIGYVRIGLSLAPGSDKVNLARTYLSYSDGNSFKTGLDYNQTATGANTDLGAKDSAGIFIDQNSFDTNIASDWPNLSNHRISDSSVGTKYSILYLGQSASYNTKTTIDPQTSVEMYFRTGALSTDTKVQIQITPVGGNSIEASFRTPSSFDNNINYVKLYP